MLKISQHGTKETYKFVPLENFNSDSDIDWSLPLADLDEALFAKYGLSRLEKEYICSSIKDLK